MEKISIEKEPSDKNVPPKPPLEHKGGTLDAAIAVGTVAAAAAHAFAETPPEPEASVSERKKENPGVVERKGWTRTQAGERVNETVFRHEIHTGGIQDAFVNLYMQVFASEPGVYYYFDARGTLLLKTALPDEIAKMREGLGALTPSSAAANKIEAALKQKIQAWHNENRKKVAGDDAVTPSDYESTGYPFLAAAQVPPRTDSESAPTLIGVIMERSREKTRSTGAGPTYFNGEERSVYDAIVEIAKAYDIPRAIALGLAANESAFNKMAERPDTGARGIYQFTKAAYADATDFIRRNPEFGKKIRSGNIGPYEQSWGNRFASAELFCAYYRVIREHMRDEVEKVESRLAAIDPGYQFGSLTDIVTINAYNAGIGNIGKCVSRFLLLSDGEIRARLGEPPYGVDAWLAVTGLSFGLTVDGASARIGPDAFQYPQKVLAMGALIMEEENYLSVWNRSRPTGEEAADMGPSRRGWLGGAWAALTGAASLAGGAATGARAVQEVRGRTGEQTPAVSRRDFLKGGVAALGIGTPLLRRLGDEYVPEIDLPSPEVRGSTPRHETYPEALAAAQNNLRRLYADLSERANKGQTGWTPDEEDLRRKYIADQNRVMLDARIDNMLGKNLADRFDLSKKLELKRRVPLYAEAVGKQTAYLKREISSGNLVPLAPNDPSMPYFCEQVGMDDGIDNDPDALYARKEFPRVLSTIVALVNEQIAMFNADPSIYGIHDPSFPEIPNVSAIKISGAFRLVSFTKNMFERGQGARTTPGVTVHWLGNALDIGSYATKHGHMVTFAGDMRETRGGKVVFKRGQKLPNDSEFGGRTREILSMMIGRALFAAREPLMEHNRIQIQPLWEPVQLNWHIALEAPDR
jgi:hypothetical protein